MTMNHKKITKHDDFDRLIRDGIVTIIHEDNRTFDLVAPASTSRRVLVSIAKHYYETKFDSRTRSIEMDYGIQSDGKTKTGSFKFY